MIIPVKAVGFDFFGTLVEAEADVNECISSMCSHLDDCGFCFDDGDFLESYRATVRGYRTIRNEDLREVNNRIWLCARARAPKHVALVVPWRRIQQAHFF